MVHLYVEILPSHLKFCGWIFIDIESCSQSCQLKRVIWAIKYHVYTLGAGVTWLRSVRCPWAHSPDRRIPGCVSAPSHHALGVLWAPLRGGWNVRCLTTKLCLVPFLHFTPQMRSSSATQKDAVIFVNGTGYSLGSQEIWASFWLYCPVICVDLSFKKWNKMGWGCLGFKHSSESPEGLLHMLSWAPPLEFLTQ